MSTASELRLEKLTDVVGQYWGIRDFRPLQMPAMHAVLDGRDSLVVLPTGGGKSLCYQAPAVLLGRTTVVISPLISLMKDQVDGLQSCGIRAVQLDSAQTADQRTRACQEVMQGEVRLLFISPERLTQPDMLYMLQQIDVHAFAIDEAHCISHWGHDFRPEYRQLELLKKLFPGSSVHAYTATATEQVRQDIIDQLKLDSPAVLVGNFDRPNLTYRVLPRQNLMKQVLDVISRHRGEGGIIYCIRRKDVDDLTNKLSRSGISVMPYHAGMTPSERHAAQDAFVGEKCDVVVATVAFGMGIDRSNVRYVLHTAMPKSVEHYQQETGRAGRDGLEAECVLLHSGADFFSWRAILEKAAADPVPDACTQESALDSMLAHLKDMDNYARSALCRHKMLVGYFGQAYSQDTCGACDICLGETVQVADADTVAQKILSCIARAKGSFGVGHIVSVLRGERTETVLRHGHDELSTWGLLREHNEHDVRDWVYQLISQGLLTQQTIQSTAGHSFPVLELNAASWEVMRKQRMVKLLQPIRRAKGEKAAASKAEGVLWAGVDRDLFEELRVLRRELATARHVPPYVIFSDATLRELARLRPATLAQMRQVYGIGDTKLRDFGELVLELVNKGNR